MKTKLTPAKIVTERYAKPTGETAALVYMEVGRWHKVKVYAPAVAPETYAHATVVAARMMWKTKRATLTAAGYAKLAA